jgi:hypothetical protein
MAKALQKLQQASDTETQQRASTALGILVQCQQAKGASSFVFLS